MKKSIAPQHMARLEEVLFHIKDHKIHKFLYVSKKILTRNRKRRTVRSVLSPPVSQWQGGGGGRGYQWWYWSKTLVMGKKML